MENFSALRITASSLSPAQNLDVAVHAEGELLLCVDERVGLLDRAAAVLARLHRVLQGRRRADALPRLLQHRQHHGGQGGPAPLRLRARLQEDRPLHGRRQEPHPLLRQGAGWWPICNNEYKGNVAFKIVTLQDQLLL